MRKAMFAFAAAVAFVTVFAMPPKEAGALTLPSQAVIADVAAAANHIQKVRRYCRTYCGYYGCRRRCWWAPRRYYRPYYRPYRYYRRY
jgi:hypothetical protein